MKPVNKYFIDKTTIGKIYFFVGIIILRIIFCTLIIYSDIYAQWSNNPAQNTQVSPRGSAPQILSDGNGGAYIAYWDTVLIVQRLNKYGYPQFPDYGIRVDNAGHIQTTNFFLVSDGSGGVLIVYENSNIVGDKTFYKAFAQRIDSVGTKVWGESGLDLSPKMDQTILKTACSDDQGGACIFWIENFKSINGGVYDLRMQRLNPTRELLFGNQGILLTGYSTEIPHHPDIREMYAAHNFNGTFVLYSDIPDTVKNLKMQRISDSGKLMWGTGIKIDFSGNHDR